MLMFWMNRYTYSKVCRRLETFFTHWLLLCTIFCFSPDPYCNPVMPGGSKFMRNPPLPMDVCFPDGNYPADAPKYEVNPDWSKATPENGKAATGYVLIDFGKKNME
jgi:hypothetical protein